LTPTGHRASLHVFDIVVNLLAIFASDTPHAMDAVVAIRENFRFDAQIVRTCSPRRQTARRRPLSR
jgi:hypothetical protein